MGWISKKSIKLALEDFQLFWAKNPTEQGTIRLGVEEQLREIFNYFNLSRSEYDFSYEGLGFALNAIAQEIPAKEAKRIATKTITIGQNLEKSTNIKALYYPFVLVSAFYQAIGEEQPSKVNLQDWRRAKQKLQHTDACIETIRTVFR